MTANTQGPLTGMRVLVTRPAHQSQALCTLLEEAGAEALSMPLLEILPPREPARASAGLAAAGDCDWGIFTSVNAVSGALSLTPSGSHWPGRIAAIGQASARALRDRGNVDRVLVPDAGFTSEGLLAEPVFQSLDNTRVILIRGEGGRRHLANTLTARGAEVREAAVYRREPAPVSTPCFRKMLVQTEVAVITSAGALSHFVALARAAAESAPLRELQLVVPSERVLQKATDWGFHRRPWVAESISNGGIVDTLIRRTGAGGGVTDNR